MDPKSGAGMESGRGNQPVAAPFASSWARGGWPLPRGTAMSLGEGVSPAPPQEDKNDHLGKSATLVQKGGIGVRAGGSAT